MHKIDGFTIMAWPTSNHPLVHGSVSDEVLQQMPSRGLGVSRRKRTNGEKSSTDDEPFIFCEVALFINTACVIQILSAGHLFGLLDGSATAPNLGKLRNLRRAVARPVSESAPSCQMLDWIMQAANGVRPHKWSNQVDGATAVRLATCNQRRRILLLN